MSHTATCPVSGNSFTITDEDLAFYEKMGVPVPTLCPEERKRQRMAWATFRVLHKRTCDGTGKPMLSMYGPDNKHPVYHSDYWWSDAWDPMKYGQNFDFSRPFFEQFDELLQKVPAIHQSVINSENCEYINMAGDCKNCFLCFYLDFCEDCYYIQQANKSISCMDGLGILKSELCYECIDCENCYETHFSQRSINCSDSLFLSDCRNCKHCIGCFNLVNKEYHIFNKPVSEKEFQTFRKSLKSRKKIEEVSAYLIKISPQFPKKYYWGNTNENFSGNDLHHTKDTFYAFHVHDTEKVSYSDYLSGGKNIQDLTIYGFRSEWVYNSLKVGNGGSDNICCAMCWNNSSYNAYCHLILSCNNCFGCSGLHHKNYCIFNKSYSVEEYEKLRTKIIEHMKESGEWGQFFPISMSPFPYNQSMAQDHMPLLKEEILKRGYRWENIESSSKYLAETYDIPDNIDDVEDSILDAILTCQETEKHYRIIKQELDLLRTLELPIPNISPEQRHSKRLSFRNPYQIWDRQCSECQKNIRTTYAPDRPEKVLCEECYLQVVH